MSDQQNPDKSHDRKGKGKVTDPAELERLDRERHLEELRRDVLRRLPRPRPRAGDTEEGAEERTEKRTGGKTEEGFLTAISYWLDGYKTGAEDPDHIFDVSYDPTGFHKPDKTGSTIDKEGSTTSDENIALLLRLDDRRETYIRRANDLRTLIGQQYNALTADINKRYVQGVFNNTTITREEIAARAGLLMVMRQHWNTAVHWHLAQDTAANLLGREERVQAVEASLVAAETTAVELDRRTTVPAPGEQLNAASVMQRIDLNIPEEFLDQDRQDLFRQEGQQRELFQRLPQEEQQQQKSLLQRGFNAQGQEIFPGSSAGPSVAYFARPRVRRPEPTAGDRGPTAEGQEQGTGGQEHGTGEQALDPREQQPCPED